MSHSITKASLAAILALGTLGASTPQPPSTAGVIHYTISEGSEKCYGIAKAGKNQCGNTRYTCEGNAKVDGEKDAWIAVYKGTCESIIGGSLTPKK
jgi:uncharacterized membrane protein